MPTNILEDQGFSNLCYQTLFSLFFFSPFFWPNFLTLLTNTLLFPYVYLSYASSCLQQNGKDTIWLVLVHQTTYSWHWLLNHHMIYLATKSPKQSISNATTGSCMGTLSVAPSSHCSKSRTSQTQNARSSASTVWMPWVIKRFLWTTTARWPQP